MKVCSFSGRLIVNMSIVKPFLFCYCLGYIFGVMQAGNTRIVSVIPPNQQGGLFH